MAVEKSTLSQLAAITPGRRQLFEVGTAASYGMPVDAFKMSCSTFW